MKFLVSRVCSCIGQDDGCGSHFIGARRCWGAPLSVRWRKRCIHRIAKSRLCRLNTAISRIHAARCGANFGIAIRERILPNGRRFRWRLETCRLCSQRARASAWRTDIRGIIAAGRRRASRRIRRCPIRYRLCKCIARWRSARGILGARRGKLQAAPIKQIFEDLGQILAENGKQRHADKHNQHDQCPNRDGGR